MERWGPGRTNTYGERGTRKKQHLWKERDQEELTLIERGRPGRTNTYGEMGTRKN